MSDVVDRDAETFQRSYAQQSKVAWFGKHYFIICLVTFGAEYGITDFSLNLLLGCRGKDSLSSRRDTRSCQNIRRQSTEFRSSIDQRGDWLGAEFFAFGIASDDVDLECAHVWKTTAVSLSAASAKLICVSLRSSAASCISNSLPPLPRYVVPKIARFASASSSSRR